MSNVIERAVEALEEIVEGKGPFSTDPLTHAANCIEAMQEIARAALAELRLYASDQARLRTQLEEAVRALETVDRMASIGENLPTGANFRRLRWIARDSLDKIKEEQP